MKIKTLIISNYIIVIQPTFSIVYDFSEILEEAPISLTSTTLRALIFAGINFREFRDFYSFFGNF